MVITHRTPLEEAAHGYKIFNDKHKEDGTLVRKVGALAQTTKDSGAWSGPA